MELTNTHTVFFSPTHTSAKIARAIASGIGMSRQTEIDLTTDENTSPIPLKDSLVIIAVPVYGGRVAPTALQRLHRLQGEHCLAILVCLYGNRDYEDALVELRDETEQLGFFTLAAGAFVGEHSFSCEETPIAAGRPDKVDLDVAKNFGVDCKKKMKEIDSASSALPNFFIKGNVPYREVGPSAPAAPHSNDQCLGCGKCMEVCPTHAITLSADSEIVTDKMKCIHCCACVKECPSSARIFETPFAAILSQMCSLRREPELFM